ncbi:PIN domain-containing protein [Mucilaginibacter gossypii]|uniref:DUF4935 domain-containing protein n=1 Tax=Mucilaginibacter gossypii TaxID=551996 RepID=A0A1G8B752_9SPHI|nr:PIN domain-containing protein [Mucilaginibacter gossypii]SDH28998.1 hypothetical protein SAMN05192573_108113 [Mucilaginibacter gossypii]
MAKNILIDTSILKQLVSPIEFSGYLDQLLKWQKQDDILIYCPATLKQEWLKHRVEEFKKIDHVLKNHQQALKTAKLFLKTPEIGEAELTAADKMLRSQVEAIDRLLETAKQITDETAAAGKMWMQKKAKKAPFRRKEASDNDAVILFAALEEISAAVQPELYFLSANHTDYAAPGNEDVIHTDIVALYPGITITYFTSLSSAITGLTSIGLPSARQLARTGKQPVPELVPVDRNMPVIDQLHDYLNKRFSDIRLLPKKLFCIHYPIITEANYDDRGRPFTMNTDNQELYDLFVGLQTEGQLYIGEEAPDQDGDRPIRNLLQFLRGNFVHAITFKDGRPLDLPILETTACTCAVCTFHRAEFDESIKQLTALTADPAPTLKNAYTFYLHGQLTTTVTILKQVAADAEQNRKWLTYYIANYNLSLLGSLLRFRYHSMGIGDQLGTELRSIKLEDIYRVSNETSLNNILDYLHKGAFLDEATSEMKRLSEKMKDHQVDQNGGWTDDTRSMLDLYFETVSFIEQNYIMIDEFSNINTFTNYFVEGLFASYTCKTTLGGKLLHFTDPIVDKIVAYGKTDELIKYRRRYDVKVAGYERNGTGTFVPQFCKMLKNYGVLAAQFEDGNHEGAESVWPRYRGMFGNALTIAGILELTKDEIAAICNHLLPFLKVQKHLHEFELSTSLAYFIRNNAPQMETAVLQQFLHFAFTYQTTSRDQLLNVFYNIGRSRWLELQFTQDEWQEIQSTYLVNETFQKDHGSVNEICSLHRYVADAQQKSEIATFLLYNLRHHFKGEVYYWAVLNDLVKPTRQLTGKYELEMLMLAEKGRQPRIFEPGFYTDHRLDEFLNFSFRYKRLLSAQLVEALQKMDDYYRWVTDLDGFDYSKFDDNWLYVHMTIYYKQKFRVSKTLKNYLRKQVMKSSDHRLGQLFIDLYVPVAKNEM